MILFGYQIMVDKILLYIKKIYYKCFGDAIQNYPEAMEASQKIHACLLEKCNKIEYHLLINKKSIQEYCWLSDKIFNHALEFAIQHMRHTGLYNILIDKKNIYITKKIIKRKIL